MPARKKTHSAAAVQDVPVEKTSVEDIVGKPSSAEASEGQGKKESAPKKHFFKRIRK